MSSYANPLFNGFIDIKFLCHGAYMFRLQFSVHRLVQVSHYLFHYIPPHLHKNMYTDNEPQLLAAANILSSSGLIYIALHILGVINFLVGFFYLP